MPVTRALSCLKTLSLLSHTIERVGALGQLSMYSYKTGTAHWLRAGHRLRPAICSCGRVSVTLSRPTGRCFIV